MNNIIPRRLSISALIISILSILTSPIILVFLFGISWALADSGSPPGVSDYILIYGINSILYLMGFSAIVLGIISIARTSKLKEQKTRSIVSIILGLLAVIIGVVYTVLIFFYFT